MNIKFNAETKAAQSQIAKLEAQLKALTKVNNQLNATTAASINAGLTGFGPGMQKVDLKTPLREMDELTERIQRGKITQKEFTDTVRNHNKLISYQKSLYDATMTSMRMYGDAGKGAASLIIPEMKAVNKNLADQAIRFQVAGAAAQAYGRKVMDTGKNMAFMGRQALLSVTAPIAVVMGGLSAAFYGVDKQLVQIQKVYGDADDTATASQESIRKAARGLAQELNNQYAASEKDVLDLVGAFAQLGETGADLDAMTSSATRLMRLGDVTTDSSMKLVNVLRNTFKMSRDELDKTINLMNVFENTSTLAMQDFADGFPKMAAVVESWGGTMREAGFILEAFTARGIDATEGANSLKTAFAKIARPTKQVQDMWHDLTGGDFKGMAQGLHNNVTDVLKEIGRIEDKLGVTNENRQMFAAQLFGAHQVSKGMALTAGLSHPSESMAKIAGMSDAELEEYAKTVSNKEIKAQMESASAQFQQALNRIKMLAESMGEKLLPIVTDALNIMVTGFEKVGGAAKKVWDIIGPFQGLFKTLAIGAVAVAAAFAPVLLIASSLHLLAGGVLNLSGKVSALFGRKMVPGKVQNMFMTSNQRAAQIQMEQARKLNDKQAAATINLSNAIRRLENSFKLVGSAAASSNGAIARATDTQMEATRRATTATNLNTSAARRNAAAHAAALRAQGLKVNFIGDQRISELTKQEELAKRASDARMQGTGEPWRVDATHVPTQAAKSYRLAPFMPLAQMKEFENTVGRLNNKVQLPQNFLISDAHGRAKTYGAVFLGDLQKEMQAKAGAVIKPLSQAEEIAIAKRDAAIWAERSKQAGIGLMDKDAMRSVEASNRAANLGSEKQERLRSQKTFLVAQEKINQGLKDQAHIEAIAMDEERTYAKQREVSNIRQARNLVEANRAWTERASKIGMAGAALGSMGLMMNSTNKYLNVGLSTLMSISSVAIMMPGVFGKVAGTIQGGLLNVFERKFPNAIGRVTSRLSAIGSSIGSVISKSFLPLAGVVAGIGAGVAIFRALSAGAREFNRQSQSIRKTLESYPEILGYTAKQFGQIIDKNGEVQDTVVSLAEKMKTDDHTKDLVDRLKANQRDVQGTQLMLEQEAVKMYYSGAQPDDVKKGIEALLNAANIDPVIRGQLNIQFDNINPTGPGGMSLSSATQLAMENMFDPNYNPGWTASYGDQTVRGKGKNDLSKKAENEIHNMYDQLLMSIKNAPDDQKQAVSDAIFGGLQKDLERGMSGWSDKTKELFQKYQLGEASWSEISGQLSDKERTQVQVLKNRLDEFFKYAREEFGNDINKPYMDRFEDIQAIVGQRLGQITLSVEKARQLLATLPNWDSLDDKQKSSYISTLRAASGLTELSQAQMGAAVKGRDLGNSLQKVNAAADQTKGAMDDASDGIDDVGDSADDAQKKIDELVDAMKRGAKGDWSATFTLNVETKQRQNGYEGPIPMLPYEMSADDVVNQRKQLMQGVMTDYMDEMAAEAQQQWDAEKRAFEARQKAESDALSERQDAESKALDAAQETEKTAFNDNWERRIDSENKMYDDRIKAIEATQEAEDDLERTRKRNAEREQRRLKYQQSLMQNGIDLNIALAGGNLDEVARLSLNAATAASDYANESTEAEQGYTKEDEDRARSKKIDAIKTEQEERIDSLKKQQQMEEDAMNKRLQMQKDELAAKQKAEQNYLQSKQEQENIAYDISFQANQRSLNRELEALRTQIPLNEAELQAHMGRVQVAYDGHGVMLMNKGDYWAKVIEDSLINRTREATDTMSNEAMWRDFGNRVALGITQGAFNMNVDEFNNFLRTGDMPGMAGPAGGGGSGYVAPPPGVGPSLGYYRHSGGPIGGSDKYNDRAGIPMNAPMRSSEVGVLAQHGEFMMSRNAHQMYGTDALNAVNSGNAAIIRHAGGPIGQSFGIMGAAIQAALYGPVISRAALAAGQAMQSAKMYGGGAYSGNAAVTPLPGGGIQVGNAELTTEEQISMWNAIKGSGLNAIPTSGTRHADVGSGFDFHMQGRAIDFDGDKQAIANWIYANYPDSAELIYGPGPLLYNKHGQKFTDQAQLRSIYAGDLGGHYDHVHWAVNQPIGAPTGGRAAGSSSADIKKKFPQYADWTTSGIDAYRQKAQQMFGPRYSGAGAAMDIETGTFVGPVVEAVRAAVRPYGWDSGPQWDALYQLIAHESSWNPHASAWPASDAYGLFQFLSTTWGTVGGVKTDDPYQQAVYGARYIASPTSPAANAGYSRDPIGAWAFWNSHYPNWYDQGGLANGKGIMQKNVLDPERVLSPRQTRAFENLVPMLTGLENMGVIGFHGIVSDLVNDSQLVGQGAKAALESAYSNAINNTSDTYNFNLSVGNVTGVDDLDSRLQAFADDIIARIEREKIKKERRLGGR